jgi:hypothetical protein
VNSPHLFRAISGRLDARSLLIATPVLRCCDFLDRSVGTDFQPAHGKEQKSCQDNYGLSAASRPGTFLLVDLVTSIASNFNVFGTERKPKRRHDVPAPIENVPRPPDESHCAELRSISEQSGASYLQQARRTVAPDRNTGTSMLRLP